MKRRSLLVAVPALGLGLMAPRSFAEPAPKPMIVSTGGVSGTYFRLMKEFDEASPGLIINMQSDGSLTNIDRVMDNQAELGITQFDALYYRATREPSLRERIRVLTPLYFEEVHFIAKSAPRNEGGFTPFGFGARPVVLNSIEDLRGRRLGFWGGAVTTEQIIASIALIGWVPVEFIDEAAAIEALKNDQVDALLAVGGQPLAWVSGLSRDYKLLPVTDAVAARLASVYDRATLSYRNLGQNGIQTLSVQAMLVTRNYTSKVKHDQLQTLHDRLADIVEEIRDTRGTHPKWSGIDPSATTDRWPMYLK